MEEEGTRGWREEAASGDAAVDALEFEVGGGSEATARRSNRLASSHRVRDSFGLITELLLLLESFAFERREAVSEESQCAGLISHVSSTARGSSHV